MSATFQLGPGSFEDSIRAAQRRQAVLPSEFYGVLQGRARANAFTVSRLAGLDQVQAIQDSLIEDLRNGGNFEAWRTRILAQPRFGHLSPAHLETIYRTNLQAHHAEGRAASILKHQDTHPFLMYSAILDTRVRPTHAALHGIILPVSHAFWKTHTPPLGFSCRCGLIALTKRQAERRIGAAREAGKVIDQPPPGNYADPGWDYDRLTGSPSEGLQRAVSRRMGRCTPSLSASHEVHCRSTELAQAMVEARDRVAEAADPDAVLARMLREGLRGERYDLALDRLGARGALGNDLSDAEAVALYLWSGDAKGMKPDGNFPYQVIGRVMRAMGRGEAFPEWPSVAGIIAGSWRALDRLPARTVPVLYRGFKPEGVDSDFWAAHLRRGEVIQYSGFTAFTTLSEVAAQFAGADGWRIIVRNATQVRNIADFAALRTGAEHLAPPMRQYRVLRFSEKARVIELEEIPEGERKPLSTNSRFASDAERDAEHDAWFEDQVRILEQARMNPRPLTEAEIHWGNIMQSELDRP